MAYSLYYLNTSAATFALRRDLRRLGMQWDYERKEWFSQSLVTAEGAASLVIRQTGRHATVAKREVDTFPITKGKPRGRGFRNGGDNRRRYGSDNGSETETERYGQTETETESEPLPESEPLQPLPEHSNGNGSDASAQLAQAIRAIAGGAVDKATVQRMVAEATRNLPSADRIAAMVQEAVDKLPVRKVEVHLQTLDAPKVIPLNGAQHSALAEVLDTVALGFRNLFLTGPSGSGKTTLARQVADSLTLPFASVSCSAGMSEGVLLGRLLPTGEGGRFEYAESPFVRMYENGGVFLLDEVDAADANTLLVLNSATANGHLDIPNRLHAPVAKRHPDFVLLAAGNTWGTGATREYVGRNQLDAAFLSRFAGATFEMDYDTALEAALVAAAAPEGKAAEWLTLGHSVRAKARATGMRRIFGTRELVAGAKLLHKYSAKVALQRLTRGWTADELAKVGAN